MLRRLNLSAVFIVLICFFLPWVQVSCGGASDTLSGFDLARKEDALLWLIPLLALAIILFTVLRGWKDRPTLSAGLSAVCGAVAALLMNRQRMRIHDVSGLIPAQLTGWFWLSLISAVAMIVSGVGILLRRRTT